MLVGEPAQEREQKLKNGLYAVSHATQDVHDGQERRAPTLASTHAARSRAFAARFRVGALGWCFASPLDGFRLGSHRQVHDCGTHCCV